jgi:uncharacterized protein YprB with RNaseH-like and TPR domain
MSKKKQQIRVLVLDIETSPLVVETWALHDQHIGLGQIQEDWSILSWAAKWLGEKKTYQEDTSKQQNLREDWKILLSLWKLLNEADIIITKNGKKFDEKKINARFVINGIKPPSPYYHIDVEKLTRRKFGFTSQSLAYITENLNKKSKKLKHKKFPGNDLWTECLKRNKEAWKEMRLYNIMDVVSLEELYYNLKLWDDSLRHFIYERGIPVECKCGSPKLESLGIAYSQVSQKRRYRCTECGSTATSRINL